MVFDLKVKCSQPYLLKNTFFFIDKVRLFLDIVYVTDQNVRWNLLRNNLLEHSGFV